MKSNLPAKATAILALCHFSRAGWTITPDCAQNTTKIQDHFNTAFERIKLAADELAKVANNQGGNSDIRDAATYLFPPIQFNQVSEKLLNLYNTGRTGSISTKANENTPPNIPGRNDVVVYCTRRRFTKRSIPVPPLFSDQVWQVAVREDSFDRCFGADAKTTAFTSATGANDPKSTKPDIIQFCPWFIGMQVDDKKQTTCKNLANVFNDKFKQSHKRTVDGYYDFPHYVVHELQHTKNGGLAKDVNSPNSYFWQNIVYLKDPTNADKYVSGNSIPTWSPEIKFPADIPVNDSMAALTTIVNLIINCGYKPNADGSVVKIPNWKAPPNSS